MELDSTFLGVAGALLTLLLAMELVDKINFRDELELARALQASLIPKDLPKTSSYEIGAHNEIANMVGGDIYDFVPLPDGRLAVLFGDASGHGMAAGLVMAVAHAAFRTQLDVDPSPAAMFATLNRILCRTGSPRAFFGCVYLLLSPDGTLHGRDRRPPAAARDPRRRHGPARFGAGAYPLGIKAGPTWPVEQGRARRRRAAAAEFRRRVRGARRHGQRLRRRADRGHRALCDPQPPPQIAAALAREVQAHRGPGAPEDDVSITVLRRIG